MHATIRDLSASHESCAIPGLKLGNQFKGRAIQFKDRGELLLLKFAERLGEVGQLESMPKLEGKRMLAIFTPKAAKKKTT